MDIIPSFISPSLWCLLAPVWADLLAWLSGCVYQRMLQSVKQQLLVQLAERCDLSAVDAACAGYHHESGAGAPVSHPVKRLVRALLVGQLYDWSTRELELQIRINFLVRWFVGYQVWEAGPDHTTLDRFAVWVSQHQARSYFDAVLEQLDAAQADQPAAVQIGDTFAMTANAARKTLVPLLRDTCRRVLRVVQRLDVRGYAVLQGQIDSVALFGPADEINAYYLDETGRAARLLTTARAAVACAGYVQDYLAAASGLVAKSRQVLEGELGQLNKLLTDEFRVTHDDQGRVATLTRLTKKERGSYRMGSARDPQATYRVHGPREEQTTLGYNISVAVTENFVREIQAATGAQPDKDGVPGLLSAQQQYHQVRPAKLIYDAAAGNPKTRSRVAALSAGQTELVAPLLVGYHEGYGPEAFRLSADGTALSCPHGQTTQKVYRNADGRIFRFGRRHCLGCPLWQACRRTPPPAPASQLDEAAAAALVKPAKFVERQVFVSDYQAEANRARSYNQTAQYKADMKRRPVVERIIAALTRYNGARRCRRMGLGHADFQAKMAAVAYNLKRWLRLSTGQAGQAWPEAPVH